MTDKKPEETTNIFGTFDSSTLSTENIFGSTQNVDTIFGTTQEENKETTTETKKTEEVKEEECTAQFTPQVDLKDLPEIEVKTLEEDEDVLYQTYVIYIK